MVDGLAQTPWLTLPLNEEDDYVNSNGSRFYNLKENKIYEIDLLTENYGKSYCIGSSHGWLILMDERANPYLLNPFACTCMQLPVIESFPSPCIKRLDGGYYFVQLGKFCMDISGSSVVKTLRTVQETFIVKAILSCDPSENETWFVFVIYGEDKKLAYSANHGQNHCWTLIENATGEPYCDMICKGGDLFFALGDVSLECWKMKDSVVEKINKVDISLPNKSLEVGVSLIDICSNNCYIVESSGDILLVVRFIGDFFNGEGRPMKEEEYLIDDENPHPHPYATLSFQIYKLNFVSNEWVELDSLGDRALFLGGNHSFSLSTLEHPECTKNSIYFTDDYWERIDEDYFYGGHDIGVYNLEDGSIVRYFLGDRRKILPVPFWIFKK